MAATPPSSSFSPFPLRSSASFKTSTQRQVVASADEIPTRSRMGITTVALTSKMMAIGSLYFSGSKRNGRLEIVCHGMLAPRKFMRRKRKVEVFKDAADEADQKNWRSLMREIEESESAVLTLRNHRPRGQSLPRDLVLGTLVRFKQMKKWNIVSEILEWLRTQHWWNFSEMDFLMLITAYGKLGDFNRAERVFTYMNKKGYAPSVISHTALMEAYGRSGQCNKAETIFGRMQLSGPEPSPVTYQIILKTFVEADRYNEAAEIFQSLLNDERSSFKPDQKMFHMMIYMYKKAGNYDEARRVFAQMADRGIPQSTVTFNSLMSFETNYKEVSNIYDQMQRAGLRPDVVSYALLIHAYGKARREAEALAVFEEMLDAGVRPTRKAYNILLDAFAISGMIEETRTVFKCMRRDKCHPDLCSYATMLLAYVNASDMEGAEKFFQRIKRDGLEPNVIIYGTLMKGYAKVNDLERMMKVYEEMRMQGIKANQTIFTTIMDAHGKNSDFGSALVWYNEMASCGFPPDQKAKNILLSLAKTPEELAEANELVGNPSCDILNEGAIEAVDHDLGKFSHDSEEEQMHVVHAKTNFDRFAEFRYEDEAEDDDSDEDEVDSDYDDDLNSGFKSSEEDNEEHLAVSC